MHAKIYYTPNTQETKAIMTQFAQQVACPSNPAAKGNSSESFYRYFAPSSRDRQDTPTACHSDDWRECAALPDCYLPLLDSQILGVASVKAAEAAAARQKVDAVIEFDLNHTLQVAPPGNNNNNNNNNNTAANSSDDTIANIITGYTLRVNQNGSPTTKVLFNAFDLAPGTEYKSYWWFSNLQAAIDQSILNLVAKEREGGGRSGGGRTNKQQLDSNTTTTDIIIKYMNDDPMPLKISLTIKPFPWPEFTIDLGATAAALFFNLLLVYSFLNPTRSAATAVVSERELQLRDGMRLLGLTDLAYWSSWAITHFSIIALSGFLCALVGMYPFQRSAFGVLLMFFWLASAALLAFGYCLSCLFSSSRVATTGVTVLFAAGMAPGWLAPSLFPLGGTGWTLACLLPPSAVSLFANALVRQEGAGRGLTWSTLPMAVTPEGGSFSGATVFIMLAVDIVLYIVLLWYLDTAMGQKNQLPWYFPLKLSYWRIDSKLGGVWFGRGRGRARGGYARYDDTSSSDDDINDQQQHLLDNESGEEISSAARQGTFTSVVSLNHVTKYYKTTDGGTQRAVNNLSLSVGRGQVLGLLGRNGAGKTTALSILAGVTPPSSGDAFIDGLSVTHHPAALRGKLGISPQFDILWPELTTQEHLELAAAIKGVRTRASQTEAAQQAAARVGLSDKLDAMSSELSGGQRRKLSLSLAFMGQPLAVVLDEPTSGIDPGSRRLAWDLIDEHRRAGCAVLLSTHSMEEADALCDRLVIISDGAVVAEGSPHHLKAAFGIGYILVCSTSSLSNNSSISDSGGDGGDTTAAATAAAANTDGYSLLLEKAVQQYVPTAHRLCSSLQGQGTRAALATSADTDTDTVTDSSGEVVFRLPEESRSEFPKLIRHLESHRKELGLLGYGFRVSTLDDVFVKAATTTNYNNNNNNNNTKEEDEDKSEFVVVNLPPPTGHGHTTTTTTPSSSLIYKIAHTLTTWSHHLTALITKRALSARRDRGAALVQIVVPILLVLLAVWASNADAALPRQPALVLEREGVLGGHAAAFGASHDVRGANETLLAFEQAYNRCLNGHDDKSDEMYADNNEQQLRQQPTKECKAMLRDTNATSVIRVPYFQPMQGSLDEALLHDWWSNEHRSYDALFLKYLPDLSQQQQQQQQQQPLSQRYSSSFFSSSSSSSVAFPSPWSEPGVRATVLTNQTALHGVPIAINNLHSALLRWMVGNDSATITTINQPLLPRSDEASARVSELSALLLLVLCFVLAASILSASYAVFIVRERESGSRALQTIAGVNSPIYWLANLTWDYIHFCIPAAGILTIVSVLISMPQLRGPRGSALAVLFLSFGAASIPMTYAAQRMFSEISALQKLSSFYFSTGFLGFLTTWILDLVVTVLQPPGADTVAHVLHIVLSWFSPHYCLAKGVFDIAQTYHQHQGYPNADVWAVLWPYVTYMLTQAVVYMILTLVLECINMERVICWILKYIRYEGYGNNAEDVADEIVEDEDVRKEREAIQTLLAVQNNDDNDDVEAEDGTVNQGSPSSSSTATLQDISKRYGLVKAVKHVWLSLPSASIFGLLGTNGAGKSTTIRILTGEEYPDRGDAVIGGVSMVSKRAKARQHVAYCPQSTALPSGLTGREVLSFYARLRGVPYSLLPFFVNRILQQFGLKGIGDRCVGQYSGGNQRRMAVAVALIAARELTVLDEPSTGLDPAARRALWEVLRGETRVRRAALMLTTHSMEEAEAICGRIAIMAGGRVKYIGTAQHLKNKLTAGYWLEVIVDHHHDGTGSDGGTFTIDDSDTDNIAKIKAAIEQCCDGWAKLKRQGALGALSYMITIKNDNGDGVSLADVYERLEKLGVEYTLSQVTLEHAFLMAM